VALALHALGHLAIAQEVNRAALIAYVDSATGLMERYSIKRAEVDWPALRRAGRTAVETSSTADTAVAYAAVRAALRKLGDHHSFLMSPDEVRKLSSSEPTSEASSPPPEIRLLERGVGYARIPWYMGLDSVPIRQYAIDFQEHLRALMKEVRCGWIVDLRGNTGGNMWPMLAGIGPVLGDGPAGTFVSPDSVVPWGYSDGYAWEGADTNVRVPRPLRLSQVLPPVAVLTDSMTASSGEAIAISFRGRPGTRSFGGPTYGLTTGNENYMLPDGSMLFLTTTVEADRTGQKYGGPLIPDTLVAPEASLPTALEWLGATGCPAGR
jgi:C-terminal processing protease CtpA/Prc